MYGKIRFINLKKAFIAVEIANGEYSVMELLGGYDVNVGDVISGNLESLGDEPVINKTQGEKMDVFIQDCHCDLSCVRHLM